MCPSVRRHCLTFGVMALLLSPSARACDWGIDGGSQTLEIPIASWHSAPPGKKLIKLSYAVDLRSIVLFKKLQSTYSFLGARSHDIDAKRATKLKVPEYSGVVVIRIIRGSPADKAGLLVDDIIVRADGQTVRSHRQLNALVRRHDLGTPLNLEVEHHGDSRKVSVTLVGKVELDTEHSSYELPRIRDTRHTGLVVGELIDAVRTDLLGPEGNGVLVMDIHGGTPVFYSKIRRGDIITDVNGQAVTSSEDVMEAIQIAAANRSRITFSLRRGNQMFVDSVLPEDDLTRAFKFNVPIVVNWKVSPRRTDFDLGLGLVLDYTREARVRSGRHEEWSEFGLVLDLIRFKSSARGKTFSLLWIPLLRW